MRTYGAFSSKRGGTIGIGRLSVLRCDGASNTHQPRSSRRHGPPSSACIVATIASARGKPNQPVITAVARELTGFVWAALTQ
jgi:hypothetical protein